MLKTGRHAERSVAQSKHLYRTVDKPFNEAVEMLRQAQHDGRFLILLIQEQVLLTSQCDGSFILKQPRLRCAA
jgi:hypothetical protein